jgi:hypothetical protein
MNALSNGVRENMEEALVIGIKNRSLGDDGSSHTFKLLEALSDETIKTISAAADPQSVDKAIGNGISMDFPFMSAHNLNIPNLAGRQVTVTLMASIEIR